LNIGTFYKMQKLYNWNGKRDFNPCEQYNWRLGWVEKQISLRVKKGEKFTEAQYQRWFTEEEKVYQNNLKDQVKIDKLNKEVGIIVPSHFYQAVWLGACLRSCQATGYFTLLAYDNPFFDKKQQVQLRMPSAQTIMEADEIVIKHKSWGSGVGIPHSWNMYYGLHMMQSLGFKYVYNINGDCIMEKPEGVDKLLNMLKEKDADIISCEYHPGRYLGTMAWVCKMDVAVKMWDMNLERMYQFNYGNAEARMGLFAKNLGLKVISVENPEDHHFKPPGVKGTFRKILGLRHLHAEHKVRKMLKMKPVDQKYFEIGKDNIYLNTHEQNTLIPYWKTGDKSHLKKWWGDK